MIVDNPYNKSDFYHLHGIDLLYEILIQHIYHREIVYYSLLILSHMITQDEASRYSINQLRQSCFFSDFTKLLWKLEQVDYYGDDIAMTRIIQHIHQLLFSTTYS
jgi:hypothetical protein